VLEEVKNILIKELHLDDIQPENINADTPLFGDELGLDSIDVLELSIVLERTYNIRIKSGDSKNREILASIGSLTTFIKNNRAM